MDRGEVAVDRTRRRNRAPRCPAGGVLPHERLVGAVVPVHPQGEPVREARERCVVHGQPDRGPLLPGLVVVLVADLRDEAAPADPPRPLVAGAAAERVAQDAVGCVVLERHLRVRARVADAHVEVQLVARHEAEVAAPGRPLREVVEEDAVLVVVVGGQVEVERLVAAPGRDAHPADVADAQRLRVVPRRLLREEPLLERLARVELAAPRPVAARQPVAEERRADGAGLRRGGAQRVVRRHVERPLAGAHLDLGRELHALAGAALLRDDLDHARRRVGAVQRGRGRALDHLDRLDVVRVQVVQRVRALDRAVVHAVAAVRAGGDAHAVHVEDRLVPRGQRAGAADADLRARARLARARHQRHARRPRGQQLLHVRDRRLLREVAGLEPRHRVAQCAPDRAARGARHDDRVQVDRRLSQLEARHGRLAGRDRDLHVLTVVPQHLGTHRVRPCGHVQDEEVPVLVRHAAEPRALDRDLGTVQRPLRRGVDDPAPDAPRLLRPGRGGAGEQHGQCGHRRVTRSPNALWNHSSLL